MPRHQATPIRRGPGCLWAKAGCRLGTGCIECERRRKQTRDRVARSRRNKEFSFSQWVGA